MEVYIETSAGLCATYGGDFGGGYSLLLTSLPEIPVNQAIYREVPTDIQIESWYCILDLVSSVSFK